MVLRRFKQLLTAILFWTAAQTIGSTAPTESASRLWKVETLQDTWLSPYQDPQSQEALSDSCKMLKGAILEVSGVELVAATKFVKIDLPFPNQIPAAINSPETSLPFWKTVRYQNYASPCWLRTGLIPIDRIKITRSPASRVKAQPAFQSQISSRQTKILKFEWPLEFPLVTSPFGDREPTWHNGIDLIAAPGDRVLASAAGRVIAAESVMGYGKLIEIDHGFGWSSVYAHNQELLVKVGQRVKVGQVIALSGNTGHTSGPHLHFEIRRNGSPIDPLHKLPRTATPAKLAHTSNQRSATF